MITDDLAADACKVLSALHDLQNGWPVANLVDGWREAAASLARAVNRDAEFDWPDFDP